MPCTQTGTPGGDQILELGEDLKAAQKKVLKLTQMLCAVCRSCDENEVPIPKMATAWWRKHKAQDNRRAP